MLPHDGMELLICALFKNIADLVMRRCLQIPISPYSRFVTNRSESIHQNCTELIGNLIAPNCHQAGMKINFGVVFMNG